MYDYDYVCILSILQRNLILYGCKFSRQAPAANLDALAKDAFEAIQPAIEALPSFRSQSFRWKKTTVDGSEIPKKTT